MSAYKVLYRKYRPRFFADVVGQPQVTVTLKNELTRGRIAHAYLFTGSRGTGKTTCAKILARAVNCLNPQNGDPCGECEVCRGLEDGSILDVVEIDAASNNGVDSIRSLIEESNFTPTTAKYRVYIIDECHMLSTQALNALLKTLEEPPAHVLFVLATTEPYKLLPTILSRCQRFDFKRISPESIADRLEYVVSQEGAKIDREAGLLIARLADGAMRDALSLLDQCLGRDPHVTLEVVNQTAGVAARDYLSALAQSVAEGSAAGALETIDALHQGSKDMGRLCEEMADYFRSLMLIKTMKDPSRLVAATGPELDRMTRQALSMELSTILHGLDTFQETLNKMRFTNPRTELEMAFVRLCSPELDSSTAAVLRRLEVLERGAPRRQPVSVSQERPLAEEKKPEPVRPAESEPTPVIRELPLEPEPVLPQTPKPEPEPIPLPEPAEEPADEVDEAQTAFPSFTEPDPAPVSEASPPPEPELVSRQPREPQPVQRPSEPAADLQTLVENAQRFMDWPEVLQDIKSTTKSVAMAFDGSAAYISGDYMLVEAPEIAFELLRRPEQRNRMRDAIFKVTGRSYKLGPYRKSQAETKDPLAELERRARESGIAVTEEPEQKLPQEDDQETT